MRLAIHQPATQVDLAACLPGTTLQLWALAKVQLRLGPSWAARTADGEVLMCGGYIYRDDETCDAWFLAAPVAARHMLKIIRGIRLTGIPAQYSRAITFVSTPEGRRIAAACGYRRIAVRPDNMEVFVYERTFGRQQSGRQDGQAAEAAGGSGAAPRHG